MVATRLIFSAAVLGLLSACYKLPSDGCPQTPCGVDLVCMQGLCVMPTTTDAGQTPSDAGSAPTDATTPPQDAGSTDTGVANDAGPEDPVCGNGILEGGEDCDDGDTVNAGCIDCITEPFGTGFVLGPNFGCSIVPHPTDNDSRSGNGVACWGAERFWANGCGSDHPSSGGAGVESLALPTERGSDRRRRGDDLCRRCPSRKRSTLLLGQ